MLHKKIAIGIDFVQIFSYFESMVHFTSDSRLF